MFDRKQAMIPAVAIQSGQKGPFVFVAKDDQTAEMRDIELLGIEGDRAADCVRRDARRACDCRGTDAPGVGGARVALRRHLTAANR